MHTNTMENLDILNKQQREWVNATIIENTLNLINDVDSYYKNIFTSTICSSYYIMFEYLTNNTWDIYYTTEWYSYYYLIRNKLNSLLIHIKQDYRCKRSNLCGCDDLLRLDYEKEELDKISQFGSGELIYNNTKSQLKPQWFLTPNISIKDCMHNIYRKHERWKHSKCDFIKLLTYYDNIFSFPHKYELIYLYLSFNNILNKDCSKIIISYLYNDKNDGKTDIETMIERNFIMDMEENLYKINTSH